MLPFEPSPPATELPPLTSKDISKRFRFVQSEKRPPDPPPPSKPPEELSPPVAVVVPVPVNEGV